MTSHSNSIEDLHELYYQLHSFEDRAKCPTVCQRRELVTGIRATGQGSKNK